MPTDRASSMLHSFGSSLENVTHLTLGYVAIYPSTLTMFVSHFPRLNDLSMCVIADPETFDGTGDMHRGSQADLVPIHLRGEFEAGGINGFDAPKEIFEAIILFKPQFRRVSLAHVDYDMWQDYWPLVDACGGSLEELRILFPNVTSG